MNTARTPPLAPTPTPTVSPHPAPVAPYPPASDMVAPLPIVANVLASTPEDVPLALVSGPAPATPLSLRASRRPPILLSAAIVAGALGAASLWHQGQRWDVPLAPEPLPVPEPIPAQPPPPPAPLMLETTRTPATTGPAHSAKPVQKHTRRHGARRARR